MFAYCGNNPVMGYDPSGYIPFRSNAVMMSDGGGKARPIPPDEHPINGQRTEQYRDRSYGLSNLGLSGCEAIAIYNALFLIERPVQFERIIKILEYRFYFFGGGYGACGFFGADVFDIDAALSSFNTSHRLVTYDEMKNISEPAIFIVGFWTELFNPGPKIQIHTVAVKYDGVGYTAYNYYTDTAAPEPFTTLDELLGGGRRWYCYGYVVTP